MSSLSSDFRSIIQSNAGDSYPQRSEGLGLYVANRMNAHWNYHKMTKGVQQALYRNVPDPMKKRMEKVREYHENGPKKGDCGSRNFWSIQEKNDVANLGGWIGPTGFCVREDENMFISTYSGFRFDDRVTPHQKDHKYAVSKNKEEKRYSPLVINSTPNKAILTEKENRDKGSKSMLDAGVDSVNKSEMHVDRLAVLEDEQDATMGVLDGMQEIEDAMLELANKGVYPLKGNVEEFLSERHQDGLWFEMAWYYFCAKGHEHQSVFYGECGECNAPYFMLAAKNLKGNRSVGYTGTQFCSLHCLVKSSAKELAEDFVRFFEKIYNKNHKLRYDRHSDEFYYDGYYDYKGYHWCEFNYLLREAMAYVIHDVQGYVDQMQLRREWVKPIMDAMGFDVEDDRLFWERVYDVIEDQEEFWDVFDCANQSNDGPIVPTPVSRSQLQKRKMSRAMKDWLESKERVDHPRVHHMNQLAKKHDHADPSVLEEPTIEVGHDHPVWDQSWGASMDYAFLDAFAADYLKNEEDFKQYCLSHRLPYDREPLTNIRMAVMILRRMEGHGLAPEKAWLSWNCVGTVAQSQWVMDRLEAHGISLNRAEYENRLKGE